MKRMKASWDILYPEYSVFTTKQLRQQASNIIENQLILKTNITTTNEIQ